LPKFPAHHIYDIVETFDTFALGQRLRFGASKRLDHA
jgi:hypothetical protein